MTTESQTQMKKTDVQDASSSETSTTAQLCLEAVCNTSRVVENTLNEYGELSVADYASTIATGSSESILPRDDAEQVIAACVESLLGETLARKTAAQLHGAPVVLTANHHGVDYFAQSVQGTLAFSRSRSVMQGEGVVIVLACGNVPLDNLTYPQGLLIYDQNDDPLVPVPRKIPLISNKKRRQLVSLAAPIDTAMLSRGVKRLASLVSQNEVQSRVGQSAIHLLKSIYAEQSVLALDNYSDQASVINHRLWQAMFADAQQAPELVYLELEKVTGELICRDLTDAESINSRLLFDSAVRDTLINELDQSATCWDVERLHEASDEATPAGGGTVLFWGIADSARPIALRLEDGATGACLTGVDSKGKSYSYALEPNSLIDAIRERRLIPSLFLSFMNLSLLRGINCLGGYYQAEYLPAMARGLQRTFAAHPNLAPHAESLNSVLGDSYLSGMQMVVAGTDLGLMPMGPLEILASGGLSSDDLARLDEITVADAHMGSLLESAGDLPVTANFDSGWQSLLASDLEQWVGNRLIVKQLTD